MGKERNSSTGRLTYLARALIVRDSDENFILFAGWQPTELPI
jgi:hypothetical protein